MLRTHTAIVLIAAVGLSCSEEPVAPTTGALQVSVTTTGDQPDLDGYEAIVDEDHLLTLAPNGTVVFPDEPTGPHVVALTAVASNCTVQQQSGSNPRAVTISTGATTAVAFAVQCATTGPSTITIVLGDGQHGQVGQSLALPFMVQVTDARGAGVAGVPVTWTVTSGDGALDDHWEDCSPYDDELGDPSLVTSVPTDDHGVAWVTFVPAGFGPGTVTAGVAGLGGAPVTFTMDATDSAATLAPQYPFDQGDTLEIIAGPGRYVDLQARVTDGLGDGAGGVFMTWEITAGGGRFRDASFPCSHHAVDSTTVTTRSGHVYGYSQITFQPLAFGITTITTTVPGTNGSPATFTLDATLVEIVLTSSNTQQEPLFFGPDFRAETFVSVGATVEWWNQLDSARITATSVPPGGEAFDSGTLHQFERFRFVPAAAGTWTYVDQVSGATGTLTAETP